MMELLLQGAPFTYEIFPIPDMGDNEKWYNHIKDNAPYFDIVISGNPRLETIFKPK